MKNPNHPKKGSSIKVEPIRKKNAIERIKAVLLSNSKYRDHCLFTLGINTGFRANELLSLTVGQVVHLEAGDVLELKQSKNKRYRAVTLNKTTVEAIQQYLKHDWRIDSSKPAERLFYSEKGGALTVPSITALLKKWCGGAGCKGNFGSHTMRKTWGYWQYKRSTPLPLLMEAYGHATQQQTLAYLCLQDADTQAVYSMEL